VDDLERDANQQPVRATAKAKAAASKAKEMSKDMKEVKQQLKVSDAALREGRTNQKVS